MTQKNTDTVSQGAFELEFERSPNDNNEISILGTGSSSVVLAARAIEEGTRSHLDLAVKVMPYTSDSDNQMHVVMSTQDRHLVRCPTYRIFNKLDILAMDRALFRVLEQLAPLSQRFILLGMERCESILFCPPDEVRKMCRNIAEALDYLHRNGKVHGNLHAGQIYRARTTYVLGGLTKIRRGNRNDRREAIRKFGQAVDCLASTMCQNEQLREFIELCTSLDSSVTIRQLLQHPFLADPSHVGISSQTHSIARNRSDSLSSCSSASSASSLNLKKGDTGCAKYRETRKRIRVLLAQSMTRVPQFARLSQREAVVQATRELANLFEDKSWPGRAQGARKAALAIEHAPKSTCCTPAGFLSVTGPRTTKWLVFFANSWEQQQQQQHAAVSDTADLIAALGLR